MFRGNHPTRVDEKGRLKVPAEHKRTVDRCGAGGVQTPSALPPANDRVHGTILRRCVVLRDESL